MRRVRGGMTNVQLRAHARTRGERMKKSGVTQVDLFSETNPEWEITCWARLDTGAARTSIDLNLADFLRLETIGSVKVRSANGMDSRPLVELTLMIDGKEYTVEASLADRDSLSCPVLIGRDILT